jgi:hypothetical protein
MLSSLSPIDGVTFLRIRSVDRLAPATRGPDSLEGAVVVGTVVTTGADSTSTGVVTVAIGGTTVTTFGGSVATMTGLGWWTKK